MPRAVKKPVRLARRTVYDNPWMKLHVDRVLLPGGWIVPEFHVLEYPTHSVAAVVEDGRGRILMVRSFRYVTDSIEWEVPVGMMEKGETPAAAARRETLEEGGVETAGHRVIQMFYPLIGTANIAFHIVHCQLVRQRPVFDANEIHSVHWMTPGAIARLIAGRQIRDGYSLAALLLHRAQKRA